MHARKPTFCPVCYKPYRDKAHLWRCLPDANEAAINLIHKNEKDAITAFSAGRLVSRATLADWMNDTGVPISLLESIGNILRRAGHVVRGEPPAAVATLLVADTPLPPGGGVPAAAAGISQNVHVSDRSDRVLRTTAPAADRDDVDVGSAEDEDNDGESNMVSDGEQDDREYLPPAAAGISQNIHVTDRSDSVLRTTAPAADRDDVVVGSVEDEDNDGESNMVSDDEQDDREYLPPLPSVNKSKAGIRYAYANSPVRSSLVKAGLYKEIPATDRLLSEFKGHLMSDLLMMKGDAATMTVTRVARFFYHFQSLCCPTTDPPTAIDVATLAHREHCRSFFAKLRSAGVSSCGQKNYVNAVRKFLQFLIASTDLPDADSLQAERLRAAINMVKTSGPSAVNRDQGDNNLRHVMEAKPLNEVMQALTAEVITTDVHNAIARAKHMNATRRGGQIKKISDKEHRLVTRYLGGAVIQLAHCQRPGVASHMTLEEVVTAVDIGDDTHLVGVKQYNTSTTYPVCVAFSGGQMKLMRDYMVFIRGEMPEDGAAGTSPFFRSPSGSPIGNFTKELNRLQVAYGIILEKTKAGPVCFTAGHARKALGAANRIVFKGDTERMKSVSDYLTHAYTTQQEIKCARMAIDSLIHGQSAQEPAPADRNAVPVVDGARPSTPTAAPTSKRALVDDGAMPSTSTAAPRAKRNKLSRP